MDEIVTRGQRNALKTLSLYYRRVYYLNDPNTVYYPCFKFNVTQLLYPPKIEDLFRDYQSEMERKMSQLSEKNDTLTERNQNLTLENQDL